MQQKIDTDTRGEFLKSSDSNQATTKTKKGDAKLLEEQIQPPGNATGTLYEFRSHYKSHNEGRVPVAHYSHPSLTVISHALRVRKRH